MLSFIKTNKIRKQLVDLYNADKELEKRLIESDLTSKDFGELGIEKVELERKKIGLAFDELKAQLPKWDTLSYGDTWKLNKPKYAYASLFNTTDLGFKLTSVRSEHQIIKNDDRMLNAYKLNVKGFLRRAIRNKVKNEYKQQATDLLGDKASITAYGLYKHITSSEPYAYTAISATGEPFEASLEAVSKCADTNIILQHTS